MYTLYIYHAASLYRQTKKSPLEFALNLVNLLRSWDSLQSLMPRMSIREFLDFVPVCCFGGWEDVGEDVEPGCEGEVGDGGFFAYEVGFTF